ncbi:uncharacterized protein OCT59_003493 [Rhizophagus irregularis]|uniref:Ricin B lectin domain-containing protein n=5 Tax=Rhizophagus irregularis TaxID=588596 RepID=A0A915ZS59_9GLOM|nr:hypothetical protein GLOIN_2v1671715 [Rhizophagus irregularis DAOM 181602=DAOM 197198]UZO11940.1 hypothetical protein OCT59_003493 [Rhizophagus irregularis]POG64810.1 hypothetical protein GLOIN_2v1671715 [Rhizophagus irregularis DAOM 181602=DAOM 197198]CAB4383730.1 unnamed protein product [Rhizophagus irregularis]CAB5353379.1 unnamed protein product [Rhizophagus irregularis]CAB5389189.1 unnamed protein product [Rhizophagus irregularis]|eukprot:XP_025171676.1 hypothetical protein GLOIN_2v1671715 [Rhizophagus irregularis DAOM 181602=DAOM 197198]
MKIKYCVFLLFIISTYGNLIPNNRVITDSEDFNLIEGITYKIVHSNSGLSLDSNGNGVYTSSISSPYQYWSLKKADGNKYNIISLKSGMNLDSNGQTAYISVPKHNSIFNPYQHWMFTKIDNDTYNIIHPVSRNLDGNGKEVYISSPEDNSKVNPYQHWLFEPSNYNLTATVMDFTYPPDIKDNLDKYKSRVNLLSGNFVFENYANATIEQTIDRIETKSNIFTLEIRKSDSFQFTINIDVKVDLGIYILQTLGINTGFIEGTGGIKFAFSSKHEKVYRETVSETVSYNVNQKIIIPPLNSVKVNSTIDKISIRVPFKAKIRVNGKADRLDENGRIVSMTDVEINALRCYLRKEKYETKNITVEGNYLIVDTSGTLEVEGYGFDTRIETYPISQTPIQPTPPPNISYFSYFILYIALIIFTSFIAYYFIKSYLNKVNDEYVRIP